VLTAPSIRANSLRLIYFGRYHLEVEIALSDDSKAIREGRVRLHAIGFGRDVNIPSVKRA